MEGRGRRADTGRTTKGYGGGRRAEGEKFLLRFSKAPKIFMVILTQSLLLLVKLMVLLASERRTSSY